MPDPMVERVRHQRTNTTSMLVDLSGKNINDDNIQQVLQNHCSCDADESYEVDLTFNRLTVAGLSVLVTHMKTRSNMRARVGENSFHFVPFFKTMQEIGVDGWIDSERLTMGGSLISKETDRLAADCLRKSDGIKALEAFNMETSRRREQDWAEQKIRWAQRDEREARYAEEAAAREKKFQEEAAERKKELDKMTKEAAERKKELDKMTKETTRKFDQFYGTEKNRCKQIEEEVEEAILLYCTKPDDNEESREDCVTVLDKKCHKIIDGTKQTVVEWDGLVVKRSKAENVLFLIEAKSYAKPLDVEDIEKRVRRTKHYIDVMADGLKNSPVTKCWQQAHAMAALKDYHIRVAIGGPSITETMKHQILNHGYYLVRVEDLDYAVTPPGT